MESIEGCVRAFGSNKNGTNGTSANTIDEEGNKENRRPLSSQTSGRSVSKKGKKKKKEAPSKKKPKKGSKKETDKDK